MRWKHGMVMLVVLIGVWALPVGAGAGLGDINSFLIIDNNVHGDIDHNARTITVDLPLSTNVTNLIPAIAFEGGPGGTISPDNMQPVDFTSPVQYTIMSFDGTPIGSYMVSVRLVGSNNCLIDTFTLAGKSGVIDHTAETITVTVPAGTPVGNISPSITLKHPNASVTGPTNFSSPDVLYVVTAEDGVTTKTYRVTVTVQSSGGQGGTGGQTTTGQTGTTGTDTGSLGTTGGGSLTGGAGGTITAPGAATPTAKPSRTVGPSTFQRKVELRGETDESRNHSFVITDALAEDAIKRTHNSAYNQEKLNAEMEVLFVSDKENTRSLSITFEESALRRFYDARIENVSFITSLYCITLNQRAIYELMQQAAGEVTISLQPVDLAGRVALIGERPAYMLWLMCGNGFAPQLSRGEITLDIAYTPNEEEDAHMLCAVDATDESNPFWVPNSYYSGGKVHLTVNKGGIIGVGASNARQFTTSFWPN